MVLQRIITAALLAPITIGVVLYAPLWVCASLFGMFLIIAMLEWARISGFSQPITYSCVLIFFLSSIWIYQQLAYPANFLVFLVPLLVWAAIAVYTVGIARSGGTEMRDAFGKVIKGPLVCLVILLSAFTASLTMLSEDPALLILMFVTIWVADAAAYFVGRRWGKHKLAVNISPGKTWEGVIGGLLFSAIALVVGTKLLIISDLQAIGLVVLGVIAVAGSVVGDLFESVLKRSAGVKDSGSILPGHGGVLDRIDGLIAAVPIYSFGILYGVSKL